MPSQNHSFDKFLNSTPLHQGIQPETAIGSPIISIGAFRAVIDWVASNGISRPTDTTIHVLRDLKQPVISKATQRALGMLPPEYPPKRVNQLATKTANEGADQQTGPVDQ